MPWPQLGLNALFLAAGIGVKYGFFKGIGFEKAYAEGVKEGFATMRSCQKVTFNRKHLTNYLAIQWELLAGMAVYIWEFSRRKFLIKDRNA